MKLIFASVAYDFLNHEDFVEQLRLTLEILVKQPRGQVAFYVPLSQKSYRYELNSHNNKFDYGEPEYDLLESILNIPAEQFDLQKDSQGNLVIEYYNKDEITTVTWYVITESHKKKHNQVKQQSKTHREYVEYLQSRPTVKIK